MKQRFILMILFIAFFTVSTSLVRTGENGQKAYRTYFLINEDAATKARVRAWENAAKESLAAQQYGTKISEWIKKVLK